jgi:hypothetical protein
MNDPPNEANDWKFLTLLRILHIDKLRANTRPRLASLDHCVKKSENQAKNADISRFSCPFTFAQASF